MASINGLEALVGLSLGLHSMVEGCLGVFVGVGEAGLAEGFVLLHIHCKQGFSPVAFYGLGIGLGLGIKLLGTHL